MEVEGTEEKFRDTWPRWYGYIQGRERSQRARCRKERKCEERPGVEWAERRRCPRLEQVSMTPTLHAYPMRDNCYVRKHGGFVHRQETSLQ